MKKLSLYLSIALGLACIINMYSCSADGDYDGPWLNKEHKTRAGNPESGLYMLEAGTTTATFEDARIKITFSISWDDSRNAHTMPQPRADLTGADIILKDSSVYSGHALFRYYRGHNGGTNAHLDMIWSYDYSYYDSIAGRRETKYFPDQPIPVPSDKFYIIP